MLLAKSRPIVVISMTGGSHFARECLMAFTPWHLDAVSGSHPPHPLWSAADLIRTSREVRSGPVWPPASDIDTAIVNGLKALDPDRPIREADIGRPPPSILEM